MLENFLSNPQATVALVAALIAAGTSIAVAFWARRNQRELSQIQGKFQSRLEELRHQLEERRVFDAFRRDRIANHLDSITQSYLELVPIAHSVRYKWWHERANAQDGSEWFLDHEMRVSKIFALIESHVVALTALQTIPDNTEKNVKSKLDECKNAWVRAMTCAYMETERYTKEQSKNPGFDGSERLDAYLALAYEVNDLGKVVLPLANSLRSGKVANDDR